MSLNSRVLQRGMAGSDRSAAAPTPKAAARGCIRSSHGMSGAEGRSRSPIAGAAGRLAAAGAAAASTASLLRLQPVARRRLRFA